MQTTCHVGHSIMLHRCRLRLRLRLLHAAQRVGMCRDKLPLLSGVRFRCPLTLP